MINRLEVMCICGSQGRMIGTPNFDSEGRQIVKFQCSCRTAYPNWDAPYPKRA